MSKIHYIGSYARNAETQNLIQFPAASTKSQYILDVIKNLDQFNKVQLLSVAQRKGKKWSFQPARKSAFDARETDYLIPSVASPLKIVRALNVFLVFFSIVYYLLTQVRKNDIVVIYHSCAYMSALRFVNKIKKFHLVMEVEELYGDVSGNQKKKNKELKIMECAQAFIFPTQLLDDIVNVDGKPAVIIHGTYLVENKVPSIFSDDRIHVLYAGTLDPRKGGAAAAAAAELPDNYHIHILGFGTDQQIRYIKEVAKKSCLSNHAVVSYDGLRSGKEYVGFAQSCQIGLSTQNPDAAFNGTSFPSKILSYLANGLRVVSIRIPAIEQSAVSDVLFYYDEQTPKEIAKAIKGIDIYDKYDSRAVITKLDQRFCYEIKQMMKKVGEDVGRETHR